MPTNLKLEIFVAILLVASLIVYATTAGPCFSFLNDRDIEQEIPVFAQPLSETNSACRKRRLTLAAARLVKGDAVTSAHLALVTLPEN
tara:strand:+ start:229 stop:492 length:264 start_codon:yes stop_codon:yes gene_type:complete